MKLLEVNSQLKDLVSLGLYKSEDEAIDDALQHLLEAHPDYKLKLAMYRYQTEEISIGKTAEIAGLCWEDMRDALIKNGIRPRFAPETIEEARKDYLTLMRHLDESRR